MQGGDLFAGIAPARAPQDPNDLFANLDSPEVPTGNLNTALGRGQANIENLQANIERLRKITPASPAHKQRVDALIKTFERQLPRGWGGMVEGKEDLNRSEVENLYRGTVSGILSESILGAADLATSALGPAQWGPAGWVNKRVKEAKANIREELDPEGGFGSFGEFVGSVAGGAGPYGGAARVVGTKIATRLPESFIGRAFTADLAGTGKVGQRIAANIVSGIPLNIAQAIGTPVTGDVEHDLAARAKQFGIGTVADLLFGFVPNAKQPKVEAKAIVDAKAGKVAKDISPERTANFLEIQEKRKAREAQAAYESEAKTQARAEWQVANKGKKWNKDLSVDERKDVLRLWKERNPILDTSKAPQPATTTPEQDAALRAGAQPIQNPAEVAAIITQIGQALEAKGASATDAVAAMKELQSATDRRAAPRPEAEELTPAVRAIRARMLEQEMVRLEAYAEHPNDPADAAVYLARRDRLAKEVAELKGEVVDTGVPASSAPASASEGSPVGTPPAEAAIIPDAPESEFDVHIAEVQAAGGLKTTEELADFHTEVTNLLERDLTPEQFANEIEQLKADFTPLQESDIGSSVQGVSSQTGSAARGTGQDVQGAAQPGSRPTADPRELTDQAEVTSKLRRLNAMTMEAADPARLEDSAFMERMQGAYNELKERYGMTDEQIAEAQMNMIDSLDDDLISPARSGKTVGAGFDPSLFNKLGANLYKGNIGPIAVKEGIQNAIDAVRPKMLQDVPGRVSVTMNQLDNTIKFTDNGIGMPPAVVEKEFIDVGGSLEKDASQGSSGGYGLAKVGLFSQAEQINVVTTADVGRKRITTTLNGSGKDWVNKKMNISSREAHPDDRTGTTMTIKILESAEPDWWEAINMLAKFKKYNKTGADFKFYRHGDSFSTDMEITEKDLNSWENPDAKFDDEPYVKEIPSAKISIYTSNETAEKGGASLRVLNNGLYQFDETIYIGGSAVMPNEIVVNVESKVGVDNPNYPFTTSREELKSETYDIIKQFVQDLQGNAQRRKAATLSESLVGAPKIEGTRGAVYATDGGVKRDLVEDIAQSTYAVRLHQSLERVNDQIFRASRKAYPNIDSPFFGGIGLGGNYLGVNIDRGRVYRFAEEQGIDLGDVDITKKMILYNPYVTFLEVAQKFGFDFNTPEAPGPLRTAIEEMTHSTIGTMVHEMGHQLSRGHNEEFAGVMTRLLSRNAEIHQILFNEIIGVWSSILDNRIARDHFFDHMDQLQEQWGNDNIFKDFSGHNVSDSRSDAGSGSTARPEVRGPTDGNEGSGAPGSERAQGVQPEGSSVRQGGKVPAGVQPAVEGQGLDAQRKALLAELVKTPIHQRGPILLRIRELNAAQKPAETRTAQTRVPPEAPPTTDAGLGRTRAPVSEGTFLESIQHTSPLEQLNPRKVETMTDRLLHMMSSAEDAGKDNTPAFEAMQRDLEKLLPMERKAAEAEPSVANLEAPLPAEAVFRPAVTESAVTGGRMRVDPVRLQKIGTGPIEPVIDTPQLDPKVAQKLFRSPLKNISSEDLSAHIEDMQSRISVLGRDIGQPYRERLDKALEERAERFLSQSGVRLQLPPAAGGFAAGFIGGFLSSDDDTDKLTNAIMWGLVGAGAGYGGGRYLTRGTGQSLVKRGAGELPGGVWQDELQKHVISDYDRGKPAPGLRERMRHAYFGLIRRTYAAERFVAEAGASRLGTARNPAKLLALAGRWTGQTESALKYGPAIYDEFGNYKKLDSLGMDEILSMVDGDVETLGALAAARTKVEMGDAIKTPFDTVTAEKLFFSLDEKWHRAADELRKFNLAMAEVLVDGGVLSRNALDSFRMETMYASLQRVFRLDQGRVTSAEKGSSNVVKASNPIKARKGGADAPIKNPVETSIAMIPSIFRAAEQNKIKNGFVEVWEAAGSPSYLMRRVAKSEVAQSAQHDAKIAALQAEIKGLTPDNAQALVAALDPSSIDPLEGSMRVYRNGIVESYKMPKELATALQTMNPEELDILWRVLGAPARLASKGVTLNPFFLAKMSFFDAWQATLNSQYGFRWGVDNIRGYMHIVKQSKKYQEFLGVGGSHQSFAGSSEAFSTKLASVKANTGSPFEVAVKQLKQMHPVEAYKTLVTPMGDAARIGEYLRALDHGASTIDAVFAAKQVTANYNEIGAFAQMRALQHMTMFLGPALQVVDQTLYRSGLHPFRKSEQGRVHDAVRYATKAFATITVPTMLLWAKYHDDEEITQLRQTEQGRRYWFIRSAVKVPGVVDKGQIVRIPKPILDGQIWGTAWEAAADNQKGKDPQAAKAIADGILRDAAFNLLPTVGVVPLSLASNTDLTWGGNIIPLADDQLALEHQGENRASWISREVSKKVAPWAQDSGSQLLRNALTPAGLDYVVRSVGGLLGADGLTAVSQAMEAQATGYVPAKEEFPLIRQVIVDYPNNRIRDVEQFYNRLGKVQVVGKTIDHLAKEDPEKLVRYMADNTADYMLVGSFTKYRQDIANYRRAIADIRKMDASQISSEDRRAVIKQYVEMMNQLAGMAMTQAKTIDEALK